MCLRRAKPIPRQCVRSQRVPPPLDLMTMMIVMKDDGASIRLILVMMINIYIYGRSNIRDKSLPSLRRQLWRSSQPSSQPGVAPVPSRLSLTPPLVHSSHFFSLPVTMLEWSEGESWYVRSSWRFQRWLTYFNSFEMQLSSSLFVEISFVCKFSSNS